MRRRTQGLVALGTAGFLIIGGLAYADGVAQTATCTRNPTVKNGTSTRSITLTCSWPKEPASTVTVTVTAKPTSSSSPSASNSPSVSGSPTVTASPTSTATASVLNLPRAPWFGGPAYYSQFPKAAPYTDASRIPIGIFYGNYENEAQARWDVDHGINFHVEGSNTGVADPVSLGDYSSAICFTSDELVGRVSDRDAVIKQMSDDIVSCKSQGRVPYTNHTGQVTSNYGGDGTGSIYTDNLAYFKKVINLGGMESADGYYYTDPSCDSASRVDYQNGASDNAHCASSANYGNFIRNFRLRDDAPLQPILGFVEDGAPGQNGKYIKPAQLDGAAWSIITNGAAGVIYFNNSFSGGCQSSGVLRTAQLNPTGCAAAIAAQMKTTNASIQALAPVINTQSYQWDFQAGRTDTMLKAYNGAAYVFASVGVNGDPGSRTFTLPAGLGSTVTVVGENRTIPVVGGKFTDSFAAEYSHHVYKVNLV